MKQLTDAQRCAVMQKCIEIAVKNGWKKSIVTLTCNYELLYDTSNGFAKALFGEDGCAENNITRCENGKRNLCAGCSSLVKGYYWKWCLECMVGTDPIVYLYNWLKEKGASK